MRIDLTAFAATLTRAQQLLDQHGPADAAERLRRDSATVMRLASGAQDRHDAIAREPQPAPAGRDTDAITKNHING